jgi:DNA-directed RNA polymerase alpha subunit
LPTRAINCLKENKIKTLGKLLKQKEDTVQCLEGLGDKTFCELKKFLEEQGLSLK